MAPGHRPARIPSGPSVIAARAASSVTMLNTTAAPTAVSRGVSRQSIPCSMSALALALVRLVPCTWLPGSRRPAMGAPIDPRPTNPILFISFPSVRCFDLGHVLAGELQARRSEDRVHLGGPRSEERRVGKE